MIIKQNQDLTKTNLFKMPIQVRIDMRYTRSGLIKKKWFTSSQLIGDLNLSFFNAGMRVPCENTFNKPISEWILQLEKVLILDRVAAINALKKKKGRKRVENALLKAAGSDPFGVRKEAVQALGSLKPKKYAKELMELSEGQDNRVKRAMGCF